MDSSSALPLVRASAGDARTVGAARQSTLTPLAASFSEFLLLCTA